jgi:hypothetical protein
LVQGAVLHSAQADSFIGQAGKQQQISKRNGGKKGNAKGGPKHLGRE